MLINTAKLRLSLTEKFAKRVTKNKMPKVTLKCYLFF